MSWSSKRKLIYLGILVIVLAALAVIPGYLFLNRPATCFDGRQDGGETGVDCGGPCVNLCAVDERSPVVLWSRAFILVPGIYSVAAYVENPNLGAQAYSVPYQFSFYNNNGLLLGSISGTTFIPSGQNFAVIGGNIATSTPLSQTDFQFGPIQWQKAPTAALDFNALQINNLKKTFSTTTPPRVEADIANTSFKNLPRVDISAILYDASGNALGVSRTYVSSLPEQTSRHIVFTWITPFTTLPTRVELLPVVDEPPTTKL